jgi:Coenzyme PQQ synthesis protein D (PqqD)
VTEEVVVVNPTDISAKVLDGEAVIINLSTGVYFSATGSGAVAWALLQAGHDRAGIAQGVAEHFGVPVDQVDDDLGPFLADLRSHDLVVPGTAVSEPEAVELDAAGTAYAPPELEVYTDMSDLLALDPPMPGLADIPWRDPDGGA